MLKRERRANNAWHKLSRNKTAVIGLVIVVIMVILAVFAPLIAPQDPNAIDIAHTYLKPGAAGHIFGTDSYGRDLFSRIVYGARISIFDNGQGTAQNRCDLPNSPSSRASSTASSCPS